MSLVFPHCFGGAVETCIHEVRVLGIVCHSEQVLLSRLRIVEFPVDEFLHTFVSIRVAPFTVNERADQTVGQPHVNGKLTKRSIESRSAADPSLTILGGVVEGLQG